MRRESTPVSCAMSHLQATLLAKRVILSLLCLALSGGQVLTEVILRQAIAALEIKVTIELKHACSFHC